MSKWLGDLLGDVGKKVVGGVLAAILTAWMYSTWFSMQQMWKDFDEMRTQFKATKREVRETKQEVNAARASVEETRQLAGDIKAKQDYVFGEFTPPNTAKGE